MEIKEAIRLRLIAEEKIQAILQELKAQIGAEVAGITVYESSVKIRLEL